MQNVRAENKILKKRSGGNMKTLLLVTTAALATSSVWADTIVAGAGGAFNSTSGFAATTGVAVPSAGTPYWNNVSRDGANNNAGYFLTGSGGAPGFTTNFLGAGSEYLGTLPSSTSNATPFTFLRDASSFSVSRLFATASTAEIAGNDFGWYNTVGGARTSISGMLNSFNGNTSLGSFGPSAGYGFYATVCTAPGVCNTFYTDNALNPAGAGLSNQHFALFRNSAVPGTFYLALERISNDAIEGFGDFNDFIVQITTTTAPVVGVPEPATFSFVGLGLVGLAISRFRRKR